MKVSTNFGLWIATILLFSGVTVAHAYRGNSVVADNAENPMSATLTGYVREGKFRDPDTAEPIRYIYLELKKPIGKYVNNLNPNENRYRKVELISGKSAIIYKLEELEGKIATVRGVLPFVFDANAPAAVLPLVMTVDKLTTTVQ